MTLTYEVGTGLYLNITNKCPCNCTFCIRHNGDGAYGSDPLWLEHQPTAEEVIEAVKKRDLSKYSEVVFCGYGEPTCELEILKTVAAYIRSVSDIKIRINTVGLSDLINKRDTAPEFKGVCDVISISLNASDPEAYAKVTRPSFKDVDCYSEMLSFAGRVKEYVPEVVFTVVDIIGEEEIEKSRRIAEKVGIRLRVREYIPD
ncbi:MAG: TIGR04100 family radical SAM protein [Ruminococcus sp.]|nr:TIGR04100 family radical SAM protein [Ruminococcus sp.]MBR4622852.1 TIGR04100 family radical SAM protein [Ruminococcus sp.]